MSIPESGDRRRAPRISTDLSGTIDGTGAVTCSVKNLSKTGALALSSHALDEMSMVQIDVSITDDDGENQRFSCEAAVVRCDRRPDGQFDLGLYFTAVSDDDREVLARIISSGSLIPAST